MPPKVTRRARPSRAKPLLTVHVGDQRIQVAEGATASETARAVANAINAAHPSVTYVAEGQVLRPVYANQPAPTYVAPATADATRKGEVVYLSEPLVGALPW